MDARIPRHPPHLRRHGPIELADSGPAGHLLAAYALSPTRPATDLTDFWVAPTHHCRGLGRLMFHHAIATATDLGATTILIESDPHAEAFYLHLGARRIAEVPSTPPGRTLPCSNTASANPTTPYTPPRP